MVVSVTLVALVVGGLVAALTRSGTTGEVLSGRTHAPAPAFELSTLLQPDRTISLSQLDGKDLVLNFWASWCSPCQQEMPALQSAFRQLHGKVRFVGIDTMDTRAAALRFLRHVHVTYTTLFDPNGKVALAYGLFGLPTTVFVSPTGKVLGRYIGQLSPTSLQAAVREAFGAQISL